MSLPDILEESLPLSAVKESRSTYEKQQQIGPVSDNVQFGYALACTRTSDNVCLKMATKLLEDLFHRSRDETARRDYLFYLSIAYAKLNNYKEAYKFAEAILKIEPRNHQAKYLRELIIKKEKKEELVGIAVVGGATAVGLAAVVGIGCAIAKAIKK